jgi:hypothetical protein
MREVNVVGVPVRWHDGGATQGFQVDGFLQSNLGEQLVAQPKNHVLFPVFDLVLDLIRVSVATDHVGDENIYEVVR